MIRSILLLCFFSGLLFRASLAHAEEGREEVQGSPLMMMRGGKPVDPSEHQKASKEERDRSDEEQCEQGERFSATETLADRSREDLSVMSIEEENTQDGDRNPLHSDNQSEKAPPAAPLYRLIGEVWNVKNRQTKEFEPTGRFDSLRRTVIDSVSRVDFLSLLPAELLGLCYDRAGDIEKKRIAYQEELAILYPDSIQAKRLKVLDPLFQKAASYQNEINGRLIDAIKKAPEKPGRRYFLLKIIEEINGRPNQVERLIEQIEEDYQKLTLCQTVLANIAAEIANSRNPADPEQPIPDILNEKRIYIINAIANYELLIQLRIFYADLIRPPYELESAEQKEERKARASEINDLLNQAEQNYRLATTEQVEPIVRENNPIILSWLDLSNRALEGVAIEGQRGFWARRHIINQFNNASDFAMQAVTTLRDSNYPDAWDRSSALYRIALNSYYLAREFQMPIPQPERIRLYSDLYQQAKRALRELPQDPCCPTPSCTIN